MTRLALYCAAKIFSSAGFCSTLRRISLFLFCAGWQGSESCWQCLSEISNANCVFLDGGGEAIGRAFSSPDVGPVKLTATGRWPVELPRCTACCVRESYQSRSTLSSCWEFLLLVCMLTPRLPIRKIQRLLSKRDSACVWRAALTRWAVSTRWAFHAVLKWEPCLFSVRKVDSYLWVASYSFLALYLCTAPNTRRCICYCTKRYYTLEYLSIIRDYQA